MNCEGPQRKKSPLEAMRTNPRRNEEVLDDLEGILRILSNFIHLEQERQKILSIAFLPEHLNLVLEKYGLDLLTTQEFNAYVEQTLPSNKISSLRGFQHIREDIQQGIIMIFDYKHCDHLESISSPIRDQYVFSERTQPLFVEGQNLIDFFPIPKQAQQPISQNPQKMKNEKDTITSIFKTLEKADFNALRIVLSEKNNTNIFKDNDRLEMFIQKLLVFSDEQIISIFPLIFQFTIKVGTVKKVFDDNQRADLKTAFNKHINSKK